MKPESSITVAIVEDNPALAASLTRIVETGDSFECVGVWKTGEEAVKKIDAFRPQIVLMDINLPGISGIEATARVKRQFPDVRILMVTIYADHNKIFAALKAGASGYILKCSEPSEVRKAILDVIAGNAPMSPEVARRIVAAFQQTVPDQPRGEELTPREDDVLRLIAAGLSNKEIASELDISVNTVQVHARHVFEKLHVRSRVEAAMLYRDAHAEDPWA